MEGSQVPKGVAEVDRLSMGKDVVFFSSDGLYWKPAKVKLK